MIHRALILALLVSALVFGQVTANFVTVTVSRYSNLQPDLVTIAVNVSAGPAVTLDQVLSALQGSGITLANFQNVNSVQQYSPTPQLTVVWTFSLPVSLSDLKSTAGQLSTLQTNIAKNNPGLTMSFSVEGTQVSPQLQQSQSCAAAGLVADATARAQKMAVAAGQPLGAIVAMSSASIATDPVTGVFSTPTYQPVCSLTAKFALGTSPPVPTDTLSIAASRTHSVQPDQVLVSVSVIAALAVPLADIVTELQGSGITAANFSYANGNGQPNTTQWTFSLPVPFTQLAATLSTLAQLQQSLGGTRGQPNLIFYLQGTQTSPELQASQSCSFPALVGDAQSQAQKLAAAAGVTLGPVAAVSEAGASQALAGSFTFTALQGDFSAVYPGNIIPSLSAVLAAPQPPPCALTVQFQLLH
ncbi:exported hypothetical protein [Candidatus Sulfopaludibacter sp. SbA4]|nr:exported hypothetical protein [Candidatus Sulfopaludibacter sp. SbA4]